jgi:cytosine/adenosine deaminase-related metal-dependent hydrolase
MRGISGSWLLTGDAETPPLAAGGLVLDDAERVLAVGPAAELAARFPGLVFERVPAVLTPGLVNAHTHLELSALRGQVPGGRGFVPWVDALVRVRAQHPPELDTEAIESGISELLSAGVVALGEVCNRLETADLLVSLPIVACLFHEVFGMRKDTGEVMLAQARAERAERHTRAWPPHLRYALAPHTPYTLHPELLQSIVAEACERGTRTSLHLAEHAAERAFLETGQGAFADWVRARGTSELDWQPPGCDAIRYAERLHLLGRNLIAVHLADARPDELALIAAHGCSVVLCPRSNLHIELKLPPLLDILRAGIRPGLGTDSLASNISLDPLAEARALSQRFPSVAPMVLIAMTTAWGADALGLGAQLGRLSPGLYPGVLGFVHGAEAPSDPARFVVSQEKAERRVLSRPAYMRLPQEVFA